MFISRRILFSLAFLYTIDISAVTLTVNTAAVDSISTFNNTTLQGNFRGCLEYINTRSAGTWNIVFASPAPTIQTFINVLPPINFPQTGVSLANNVVTIDGGGLYTLNASSTGFRPLLAYQGTVILQNLTLIGSSTGGSGGANGGSNQGAAGGGMGAGGALLIDGAAVTLNNVTISGCKVTGGSGGTVGSATSAGGGGGGLGAIGGGITSSGGGSGNIVQGASNTFGGAGGGGGIAGLGGPGGSATTTGINSGCGGGGGVQGSGNSCAGATGTPSSGSGGGGYSSGGSGVNNSMGGGGTSPGVQSPTAGAGPFVNLGGGGGGGGAGANTGGAGGSTTNNCVVTGAPTPSGGAGGGDTTLTPAPSPCGASLTVNGGNGGLGGGGGGGGVTGGGSSNGGNGGLGGGGGGCVGSGTGGTGGYGGGGGGGSGNAGFGGGGGGAAAASATTIPTGKQAGSGGFGGGGGGGAAIGMGTSGGNSGFGGGAGGANGNINGGIGTAGIGGGIPSSTPSLSGGGGGAALGAAIFLIAGPGSGGANGGGSLTIQGGQAVGTTGATTTTGSLSGGGGAGGGSSGAGFGTAFATTSPSVQEIFVYTGGTNQAITFNTLNAADTITIGGSIGDDNLNTIPSGGTWTAGNASGGVSLTKSGPGTLTLQGNSTYTGNTNLNGGVLQIAGDTSLGANVSPLNFANGTTLQLTGSSTSAARPINILANASSTIDTQTFSLNNVAGAVTFGGGSTLSKISAGTLSLGGSMTGSGNLNINAGTVVLGGSGTNTYSGPTAVASGAILQAAGGSAFSKNSSYTVNGTLNLNSFSQTISSFSGSNSAAIISLGSGTLTAGGDNSSNTFPGTIVGTGGLVLTGTGTLTLSGTSAFSGPTTVMQGTLRVNGPFASSVTVANSATLRGTGTIQGAVDILNGGTIHAGNSIGTMTVGSLTLNSGSTLNVEFSPTTSSLYVVNGNATLAGILQLTQDAGTYAASNAYTFLTTNGTVSGTFSSITGAPAGFVAGLGYTSNSVQLVVVQPALFAETVGLNGNPQTVFNYLAAFSSVPSLESILANLVPLSKSSLTQALITISPSTNASTGFAIQQTAFSIGNISTARLNEHRAMQKIGPKHKSAVSAIQSQEAILVAESDQRKPYGRSRTMASSSCENATFWGTGFGDFLSLDGQNQNPNFSATAGGGAVGFDWFGKDGALTGSAGYIHTSLSESNHAGQASSNGAEISLYGTGWLEEGYLEVGVFAAWNRFKNERNISIGGSVPFSATATSNFTVWQVMPHLAGGGDIHFDWGIIEPFASLDWVIDIEESYQETGAAPLNMSVNQRTPSMLRSEAGFNLYQFWDRIQCPTEGNLWILQETLSYVNKAPFNTNMTANVILAGAVLPSGAPSSFTVQAYNDVLNLFSFKAEVLYKHKPSGFFISADYAGEFGSGYMSNEVQGTLGIFF